MKITLKDDIVKSEVRGGYRINLEEANMRLKKRIDEDLFDEKQRNGELN